ncbi:DUF1580 domain-containing protein [Pirellulaceae bacterium SH467]
MNKTIDRPKTAEEAVSQILTEDVISLDQAMRQMHAISGYRPEKPTLIRWITRGVGGVRLEAIKMGGRYWYTSTQALNRFITKRNSF